MLKVNEYGGERQAKGNEKRQCFKGVGNFSYFSNLPICRRSANSLNRRKLLICRTTPQSFDLHNITKVENQTKNSSKQISNDENKRKRTQI